ncbi:hypothetical protein Tco_0624112 [Tanacetum coccineum]|uniref:Uncharacterized protein n=1 Tax=Tanacetum coccineum TaxID=301880 RepID=A0ABQ4WD00_9ASTR
MEIRIHLSLWLSDMLPITPNMCNKVEDEETDIIQKVMEESLKDAYLAPRGPLPPVVIREPEPGKYEPLPEVQGRGKEKVGEEQAA